MTEPQPNRPPKLKRVVIKEELVALTGHYMEALVLNQFIYWSERTGEFDKFIAEEKVRDQETNMELTHGWIYKSADELSDELMTGASPSTVRRYLSSLVKKGYLAERHNPKHKWDRCLQYRPDIIQIQRDLQALGYALDGYPLLVENAFSKMKNASSEIENQSSEIENQNHQNEKAIPETTPETTTESKHGETHVSRAPGLKSLLKERFLQVTQLPEPATKPDQKFWWGRFGELARIFGGFDDQAALAGMEKVIKYMENQNLTVAGPESIVKLCRQYVAQEAKKSTSVVENRNPDLKARYEELKADKPIFEY